MTVQTVAADEQLTVSYGPHTWYLMGPDGEPVFEARNQAVYYLPMFGRWRDLPPGDRISVEAVACVEVRWDGGWAVGLTLAPNQLWRRLVRWKGSRQLQQADEAAKALSQIIGRPYHSKQETQPPASIAPEPVPGQPVVEQPQPVVKQPPLEPLEPPLTEGPQVYAVSDAADVRLPLRLGGGSLLSFDDSDRLVLTISTGARLPSLAITVLGVAVLALFILVIWLLRSGALADNPIVGVAASGGGLIVVGLLGMWLLWRFNRQLERRSIFDRAGETITLAPADSQTMPVEVPLSSVHGVRIFGEAVQTRSTLAYKRKVMLVLDSGDISLFDEVRSSSLPPDPAVMPSLPALRRQADEQAGPSLARAGARVIAWYLGVPLADE